MNATATEAPPTDDTAHAEFAPFLAEVADPAFDQLTTEYRLAANRRTDLRARLVAARQRRDEVDAALLDAGAKERARLLAERGLAMAEMDALPGLLRAAARDHCLAHLRWLQALARLARGEARRLETGLEPASAEALKLRHRLDANRPDDDRDGLYDRLRVLATEARPTVARPGAVRSVAGLAQARATQLYGEVRLDGGGYAGLAWDAAAARAGEREAAAARKS